MGVSVAEMKTGFGVVVLPFFEHIC